MMKRQRTSHDLIFSPCSGQRLEESLEYQQFVANVEEEEAWINEKMTLVASEDYGDTLAAIQVGRRCCRLLRSSDGVERANPWAQGVMP